MRSGRCYTTVLPKRGPQFDENVDRRKNVDPGETVDLTIEPFFESDTVGRKYAKSILFDGIIPDGRAVHR